MYDKLDEVVIRVDELLRLLVSEEVLSDKKLLEQYGKELNEKKPVVDAYQTLRKMQKELEEAKAMADDSSSDQELREMAQAEYGELVDKVAQAENDLKLMLLPQDPNDSHNVYLEVRAGTGGDEATIFAGNLYRMYQRYAELNHWKFEPVEIAETGVGGIKEVVIFIKGKDVYKKLKYEGGGHRVQRIPDTEANGRIHTSACTVAVLPEADDVAVVISESDLRIDTYRSSGAGGQHVNTTDSAVRITHLPTGIVVSCQDERSQIKNREKAMKLLKSKVLDEEMKKQHQVMSQNRKLQVGSGDRSERIRTYNFPQNRLTDHRINLTLYSLEKVMDGEIEELVTELMAFDNAERLRDAGI